MVAAIRKRHPSRYNPSLSMAKKKRSRQEQQQEEEEDDENLVVVQGDEDEEEEDVEMKEEDDDDDDEKEEEDEEEEEPEVEQASPGISSPFLDAFYGLAATDPRERAVAAQTILWHISSSTTDNAADARYAWKRLLRGLGSGRAAARQGNASALSALVKMGMQSDLLLKIRREEQQDNAAEEEKEDAAESNESMLEFVRQRLLAATKPPGGKKKKGSDERDALFGRLFGIVAIIRSGILTDYASDEERMAWLQDLANLYRTKPWMREPTAHAVCLLLQSCRDKQECDMDKLVPVVLNELLTEGDNAAKHGTTPLASFSAEQIALAMFVQHLAPDASKLPEPWNQSLLSTDILPVLAPILASTSHVTQPRTHLVWDVVAMALTASSNSDDEGTKKALVDQRTLQAAPDVLVAIFQKVVQEQLLGLAEEKVKATDDRRALALCLVRQWAGVEFVSSLAGRTVLQVNDETLKVILSTRLVRRLFMDLVSTKDHYLKPLAEHVLQQIVEQAMETSMEARTALIRIFLSASTRFDGQCKSTTLSTLLGWQADDLESIEELKPVWESVMDFCQERICGVANKDDKSSLSPYDAVGLVDLLFHHGKFLIRLMYPNGKKQEETKIPDFVSGMMQRIGSFFLTTAFFDCGAVKSKKNKSAVVKMASQHKGSVIPYELRCVISARYFSLLAEQVAADLHANGLAVAVQTLQRSLDDRQALIKAGAKSLGDSEEMEESPEGEEESPEQLVANLRELIASITDSPQKGVESLLLSTNLLASVLYLHLLNCGAPDDQYDEDDPDVDHAEDKDEVENFLQDVHDVAVEFQKLSSGDASAEEDTNPLNSLASLCVNILSSPLTSGSHLRGAAPKMLREGVRQLWIQGMVTASQAGVKADPELLGMLLDALGAKADALEDGAEESDEGDEDEDSDAMDDENEEAVFAKAASMADVDTEMKDDSNNSDEDEHDEKEITEDDNEEIEVDHSRLQLLLQEDDDASVDANELEHHAGADAALARLIKLKQDARKAGQKAREKIELSNNVRCVVLLETLLMGKPDGWGALLSPSLILSAMIPLLERRRQLEKDLSKMTEKGQDSTAGEKRGLLDRITSLIRQRLLKTKVAAFPWSSNASPKELVLEIGQILVKQAEERNSKEHAALVGASLVFSVKALPDTDKVSVAKEIYVNAVEEWSSKRSNRLDAKLFEDLIHQASHVSQSVLTQPLVNAASGAKTSFLKMEAFRLLSLLLNPKLHQGASENEDAAITAVKNSIDSALGACVTALQDADMKKAKRAREVLKTLEKSLDFAEAYKCSPAESVKKDVKEALQSIGTDSESQGLKALAEKLSPRLDNLKGGATQEEVKVDSKKSKKGKKKGKKKR